MRLAKFATQVDPKVLKELRAFAKESGKSLSRIVTDALTEHLKLARVRPAFQSAMVEVIEDNQELLKRLAK
jgi:hypothetical protein